MSSPSKYRPRLSAELEPEQAKKLFDILPHGYQKPLFQILVDGVINLHAKGGIDAIGAIILKALTIEQLAKAGLDYAQANAIENLQDQLDKLKEG